jgi:hypothetical protein
LCGSGRALGRVCVLRGCGVALAERGVCAVRGDVLTAGGAPSAGAVGEVCCRQCKGALADAGSGAWASGLLRRGDVRSAGMVALCRGWAGRTGVFRGGAVGGVWGHVVWACVLLGSCGVVWATAWHSTYFAWVPASGGGGLLSSGGGGVCAGRAGALGRVCVLRGCEWLSGRFGGARSLCGFSGVMFWRGAARGAIGSVVKLA